MPIGACERGASSRNGSFVVAVEGMPQDLDPRFATDAASARIGELVFRSLTRTDARGRVVPDLATDWTFENDRTVRFRLHQDVVFHDGTALTADDVRATFLSVLDPTLASPKKGQLAVLEAVDVIDERTLRFRTREPHAPFLTATTLGIVPAEIARSGKRTRVGSGPFRVDRVVPDQEVRLTATKENAGIPTIRFRVVPDDTVRALELRNGGVHFAQNAVAPEQLDWLRQNADVCIRRVDGTTFHYLGMNLEDPRLADVRVRRAIALALNREALVEHLLEHTARPATGLLTPEHWAYEKNVRQYPHDPDRARRLLDEAGFTDPDGDGPAVRFRISYKTTTLASRRRIAEAIQADLGRIGIGIDIRSFEWGTFYGDVRRGNFELYTLAWVGVTDPDIYYDILHSGMTPPRGNNRNRYRSDAVDRWTEAGRRTLDRKERRRIYARVQKRVSRDLPFVPLWWTDNIAVHHPGLCGYEPFPDGSLDSFLRARWKPGKPCGCSP